VDVVRSMVLNVLMMKRVVSFSQAWVKRRRFIPYAFGARLLE